MFLGVLTGALFAFQTPAASAQPGTQECSRLITVREYRTNAVRIYHRESRIWPRFHYRLNHFRECATGPAARARMEAITKRQARWRIMRRERAERLCGTPTCNRRLGAHMAAKRGWTGYQFACLDELWGARESGWDQYADNPTSDAYGIPQALPGWKMGTGWQTSPFVQIRWGLGYIAGRYGTPCGALSHSHSVGWY